MRREFSLPEEDIEFLNSSEWEWETIVDGNNRWLLINNFPVPNGYNQTKVTAAIQILSGYPTSQLDMVYFYPALHRKDNISIGQANVSQNICGVIYQRWSRHYQWKPGLHSLTTHILVIEEWLQREFDKNPLRVG
ncbi:E2/UBC family protein [Calidifontibacillus oryziterrae]|uniref:E2/UBC family protein n=1 Tax=Calidifontibacillus oryziterrae TaxID=1191699 RepID=UPI00035D1193|nr:E2/UBC family protein [Calidifontibacillus oryziterrae]